MQTEQTDVLIVGAGPTGLALSIALLQRGVRHVLIDRLQHGQNTSRAGVIHAQTLESLAELGVSERLTALGLPLSRFAIRDRDRALLRLRFDRLPTRFPYLLMLPQNLTEQVLAERVAELGGGIRRGVSAQHIERMDEGARVVVAQGERRYAIEARFVVGADGMHSVVRQSTDIGFEGASYEASFVLADVQLSQAPAPDEVSLFFAPEGLVVVAPLPGGTYRIVATMDDAPEQPTAADVQRLLDARGPSGARSRVLDVVWSSRFRLHHRLASAYRQGPLIVMGDAAHVHSPAGGQGMNTGLVDAVVLGRLLGEVVAGARGEAELALYEALRRPAAQQVLGIADRLTTLATMRSPIQRWARNAFLWIVDRLPPAKQRIALSLSGLARAALARVPASERNLAKSRTDISSKYIMNLARQARRDRSAQILPR